MRLSWWCLALIALGRAAALYEDQAGFSDWHSDYFGRVIEGHFAFKNRERAFVATEKNVVASFDTRDGSTIWRQVLSESDLLQHIALIPRPASVASLSSGGRHLRLWNALDGSLLWEKLLSPVRPGLGSALSALPDVTGDGNSELAVLSGGQLQAHLCDKELLLAYIISESKCKAGASGCEREEGVGL